jgi:dipeptidase
MGGMCDTMVHVRPDGVLFAKNSDRDPNESQGLEWHAARRHAPGATVGCTWVRIPQAAETLATLISRPCWMWGAEMGANEAGVVIGNEAVFTTQPRAATGLTGMDLVRLGLERGANAEAACAVIVALLETHGQGGGCGHERRGFSYHNSFLIADAGGAVVLETAGRLWAVERVASGARSISNGLTIPAFAARHARGLAGRVAESARRQARSAALCARAAGPADLFAALRDHGPGRPLPRYRWHNGALSAPCAHAGGLIAATQTTASWVSVLRGDGAAHWVTATAAPCTGLFKPVRVGTPLDLGPFPGERADGSLWWRHEAMHRRALRDPARWLPRIGALRDPLERAWVAEPPAGRAAFDAHEDVLRTLAAEMRAAGGGDTRPRWVRGYWRRRNRRAGLEGV